MMLPEMNGEFRWSTEQLEELVAAALKPHGITLKKGSLQLHAPELSSGEPYGSGGRGAITFTAKTPVPGHSER